MAGQVPSRKYRIERYLAEGGMGAIYVGKKIGPGGFEKEVVLKQLLPEFTSRPEFRDLFFREAKITATLDHQNIVRTFDLVNANERLFIVMEFVRGADLRTIAWRARRRKPLSARAILHVGLEILAGLAYAHSRRSPTGEPLGIIHRDLSPSNILLSGEGEVKLSDFGIAKAVTYSSVFYRVRGKVGYMSPEMARNQPIDARSDLFSLGVSIYETLIGERIYTGDLNTPPDKIYAQVVPPLASKCPALPPGLQQVLDKALAIDRDARYKDAEAFAHDLRQVAALHGLLCSAPELATELREIMGPDAEHWLTDKRDPLHGRSIRPGQAGTGASESASDLVKPGTSIDVGDDSDIENVATPPARPSGSMPAAGGRPSGVARSSSQWPAATSRSSSQLPSVANRSSSELPSTSRQSSSDVPKPTSPSSAQLDPVAGSSSAQAPAKEMLTVTPPPGPPAPPASEPGPSLPALARPSFAYAHGRMGGVAAFRRSHRSLWIAALLVLAVLLGFGFVRLFFGTPAKESRLDVAGAGIDLPSAVGEHAARQARRTVDA